ncbi:MAG TPA: NifU family protein [Candidatus Caccenecus avistercoris]|nr:NifU family protein [Candidatus Caccenecus avistercoris]
MEEQVKELIESIRPFLIQDGGDIEFLRIEDNYVYIKLTGACKNCLYQDGTISYGIEALIKDKIPEIEGVINVDL